MAERIFKQFVNGHRTSYSGYMFEERIYCIHVGVMFSISIKILLSLKIPLYWSNFRQMGHIWKFPPVKTDDNHKDFSAVMYQ
jgi:hypothetical protein